MTFKSVFEDTPFFFDFTKENLISIYKISDEILPIYAQLNYLYKYLLKMNCKFIIVEKNYTDKYYLDDFLHFYANCHSPYEKKCQRIHFFKEKLDINLFLKVNKSKESYEEIQSNYLGFTVIRPVPDMLIGRTLLSVYPNTNVLEENANSNSNRNILAIHNYLSNLCGFDLKITSLPFQEQDNVVHACATTAIWIVLEQSTYIFNYYSPTPYEIKISAPSYSNTRPIPTSGLTVLEIIGAIRNFGMEVEIGEYEQVKPHYHTFSSFLYAFLRGGIPILLSVDIRDADHEIIGSHALAVLGYKLSPKQPDNANHLLTGNRINKLYIHDDNFGPFTSYTISEQDDKSLILKCEDRKTLDGRYDIIIPDAVIVPIYHKIRYPYIEIIGRLSELLDQLIILGVFLKTKTLLDEYKDILEWDIYITSVNKLKVTYRKDKYFRFVSKNIQKKILTGSFPRFIWRCRLIYNKIPVLEVLGDATEAKTQFPFFCSFCYTKKYKSVLEKIFQELDMDDWKKSLI